jgi:hypothetical protein
MAGTGAMLAPMWKALAILHQRRWSSSHTILVCGDVFPCQGVLLIRLGLEVFLSLLQHIELRSEAQNGILGAVFPLLRSAAAKPAPDTRHFGYRVRVPSLRFLGPRIGTVLGRSSVFARFPLSTLTLLEVEGRPGHKFLRLRQQTSRLRWEEEVAAESFSIQAVAGDGKSRGKTQLAGHTPLVGDNKFVAQRMSGRALRAGK